MIRLPAFPVVLLISPALVSSAYAEVGPVGTVPAAAGVDAFMESMSQALLNFMVVFGLCLFGFYLVIRHSRSLENGFEKLCNAVVKRLRGLPVVLLMAASTIGPALALETPTAAPRDSRIRFVNFEPYNVVRVIGTLRSSVQVQFAPDEEIVHVASGNNVAWEVAPAGNILFLKPREKQPLTNLQVVTARRDGSKRSYQFELTVRDGAVGPGTDTYFLVKFRYPGDEAEVRRLAAAEKAEEAKANQADKVLEFHGAYGPRNWRYSAQGSQVIEPVSVYDNGKVTTFAFAGNTQVPAIYTVSADGTESLVPSNTEGDLVTVHAIAAKFILRRGSDVTCIFNEAYDPAGINPGTGTTSPSVSRVMKPQASAQPKKN